ncbi:MAG: hypothetical protein Q8M37_06305 [Nevskia sp.]|nr:hypothetical protein [Nevskia sp.]
MTSPELTGGAGFTYEDAVTAQYLAAMITGTTAVALGAKIVQRVAQQQADFGEPLDDVIVDAASLADGAVMRLSLQVKRSLTISDAVHRRKARAPTRERDRRGVFPLVASDCRQSVRVLTLRVNPNRFGRHFEKGAGSRQFDRRCAAWLANPVRIDD